MAHDVRKWAIEQGDNKLMRICLAGYEGEHEMPDTWETVEWKAQGGFGNLDKDEDGIGRKNSKKERLWFSPGCIRPHRDVTLFDILEAAE